METVWPFGVLLLNFIRWEQSYLNVGLIFFPTLEACYSEYLYEFARASITEHHRPSGLPTEIHFLPVLEARNLKSRCWQGFFFFSEASLLGLQMAMLSLCPHIIIPLSVWPVS